MARKGADSVLALTAAQAQALASHLEQAQRALLTLAAMHRAARLRGQAAAARKVARALDVLRIRIEAATAAAPAPNGVTHRGPAEVRRSGRLH